MYDFAIVGGGIVGLAIAHALQGRYPSARLAVVEKESTWASHQTGRNSGVIHSGVYYRPGSFKAEFCREGNRTLVQFAQQHHIAHEICGKVIIATQERELPRLEALYQRGLANGIAVTKINSDQVREIEPHVQCLAGMYVPTAGIIDYRQVCDRLVALIQEAGGELRLNTKVLKLVARSDRQILVTDRGEIPTHFAINCAGLYSDRVTRQAGLNPGAKIVPFRGEYYNLKPDKTHLVKGLIYPVPNPEFPFLGVHFTRAIDGGAHAGPNAVLALKREGYRKQDIDLGELAEVLAYPGFWRLVSRHAGEGLQEMWRSLSRRAFVRSLQQLMPVIEAADIEPAPAGVRAQALQPDGKLVEDFLLVPGPNSLHVCNAPSPAATSSLAIGQAVAAQVPAPASVLVALS